MANPVPPGPSAGSQVPMATAVVYLAWTGLATSAAAVLLQGRPQLRPELLECVWVDCLWLQVTEGPSEGPLEGL